MKAIEFFREGLKNIKTVGTLTRSSRFLCKRIVDQVDFDRAKVIVELGAGDGVITRHILERMGPDARLLAFEVNEKFCEKLRSIDDDRLQVIEDSAEELGKYLAANGSETVDYVISAIPFVALPKELSLSIIRTCHNYLALGGLYIQVHYSLLVKNLYQTVFGNVNVKWMPLNVPPAFVLISRKTAKS